ncbi:MAG: glycoside hydrolase family 99-like domain-containing protein, partial [Bdellovibrionales bacterium]|nr:glycoside hydrolase family 99-like domain-containing protein [Bdellovibrionales bacterium]
FWVLWGTLLFAATRTTSPLARRLLTLAAVLATLQLAAEVLVLGRWVNYSSILSLGTQVLFIVAVGVVVLACFVDRWGRRNSSDLQASWNATFAAAFVSLCIVMGTSIAAGRSLLLADVVIGAHYYSWFPENWKAGYVGEQMEPPILPAIGQYRSDDPAVFPQHLAWARSSGINLIIFDWWPDRVAVKRRILDNVHRTDGAWHGMRFAIHYETLDLKTPEKEPRPGEPANMLVLDEGRAQRMAKHWEHIARTYMDDPAYFRVDGRPVLFLYATRHVLGDVRRYVAEAREHVLQTTGQRLFLVGDEVYFNVPTLAPDGTPILLPEQQPDWSRLSAFDAITGYNPFDSSRKEHAGSAGRARFLADVAALYDRYRRVAHAAGQMFIPTVLPGYNDRGVRLATDHFVVPRQGPSPGESFFEEALRQWALPFLDEQHPMLAVTSWNEWNEGTQIEPTRPSPETNRDRSESGDRFSAGEILSGYGCRNLVVLRRFFASPGAAAGTRGADECLAELLGSGVPGVP